MEEMLGALADYRDARLKVLDVLKVPHSNRDPLPELADALVARWLGGTLAPSRVQRDYDVIVANERVQVRSLSNTSSESWINEHTVGSSQVLIGTRSSSSKDLA